MMECPTIVNFQFNDQIITVMDFLQKIYNSNILFVLNCTKEQIIELWYLYQAGFVDIDISESGEWMDTFLSTILLIGSYNNAKKALLDDAIYTANYNPNASENQYDQKTFTIVNDFFERFKYLKNNN